MIDLENVKVTTRKVITIDLTDRFNKDEYENFLDFMDKNDIIVCDDGYLDKQTIKDYMEKLGSDLYNEENKEFKIVLHKIWCETISCKIEDSIYVVNNWL